MVIGYPIRIVVGLFLIWRAASDRALGDVVAHRELSHDGGPPRGGVQVDVAQDDKQKTHSKKAEGRAEEGADRAQPGSWPSPRDRCARSSRWPCGRPDRGGARRELTGSLSHFGDHPLDNITATDLNGLVIKA
jgi:hypothetical protein